MDAFAAQRRLKQSIRDGVATVGLFVKTPAMQIIELLSKTGLDFLALDAEHAAFGTRELDTCLMAGRALGVPMLVRIREPTAANILGVLDMGAAGIIAPHVRSADAAASLLSRCRYRDGTRGFSGFSRASDYGTLSPAAFRRASDEATIVVAQIEDAEALDNIDSIAAVDGVDALFIGRADLAVSLQAEGVADAAVMDAVRRVLVTGKKHGRTTGLFLTEVSDMSKFQADGASLFVISSDQQQLAASVSAMTAAFRTATGDQRDR